MNEGFVPRVAKDMVNDHLSFAETEAGKAIETDFKLLSNQLEERERLIDEKMAKLTLKEKEILEVFARAEEDSRVMQEKLEKERQEMKQMHDEQLKKFSDEQEKAQAALKEYQASADRKEKEWLAQVDREKVLARNRADEATRNHEYSIRRLESLADDEARARRAAQSDVANYQSKLNSALQREKEGLEKIRRLKSQNYEADLDKEDLEIKLADAKEKQEKLRKRIHRLEGYLDKCPKRHPGYD